MIRGNDFILNPNKLEEQFQLVEVSDWVDFSTKEKLGFYYTVLFPKLKFEKVKVGVKVQFAVPGGRHSVLERPLSDENSRPFLVKTPAIIGY